MLFYPTLLKIDDERLTDQGRSPLSISREERSVINELASGLRKKYVKGVKHTFSFGWTLLPSASEQTIDGGLGRNILSQKFGFEGGLHILVVEDDALGFQEFNVFIDSYSEELVRRDPASGIFLWNVSMELSEQ